MVNTDKSNSEDASVYEIRVQGHLAEQWTDWFDGLNLHRTADGDTVISGHIPDQAALYRILKKIRDTGMKLVSVNQTLTNEITDDQ